MTQKASVRMEEIRRRTRRLRQRRAHRINCTLSAVCLFLTVGIASLLYQEHVPGLSIVLAGYGSVLLHSGADAYIVVSVGSFATGVVFTLLGIRYRQYKALHRPSEAAAVDAAGAAAAQQLFAKSLRHSFFIFHKQKPHTNTSRQYHYTMKD